MKKMSGPTKRVLFILCVLFVANSNVSGYDFILLHTNDIHAQIEQFNKNGMECNAKAAAAGKCFGGIPRTVTAVNEIRAHNKRVILVDAGDYFTGSILFYHYKSTVVSFFMNHLGYDAMCLGNHEFDTGVEGLVSFLDNVTFPVVSANTDIRVEPRLNGKFSKHTIRTVGGQQIGIVGYLTQETFLISNGGPTVTFDDVITSVTEEVAALADQGINKIIALGHAGFAMDLEVAKIEGVDIVVGGHTNTFLYNGDQPSNDAIQGPYPTVVTQGSGKTALVVQDYTWGKYLGYLNVTFNDNGDVTQYNGNPLLLNSSITEDNETVELVRQWAVDLNQIQSEVIGSTNILLDGRRESCRLGECIMGNIFTDSVIDYHLSYPHSNNTWTPAAIAIWNGGGLRASIEKGPITMGNVLTVLPFGNEVDLIKVKGSNLRAQLEHSVSEYDPEEPHGRFLHFSGLKVVYNLTRAPGYRVLSVDVRCLECNIPSYSALKDNAEYKIFTSSFFVRGGDGYEWEPIQHERFNTLESKVFTDYLKRHSPVYSSIEGRITFKNSNIVSSANSLIYTSYILVFNIFVTLRMCSF